jgi:hypothetical protein
MGLDGEEPVNADLKAVVGDDRKDGRGQAHCLPHGQGNVGVEASGGLDVAGHGHKGDGEEREYEAREEIAGGCTDASDADGQGSDPRHYGQRRCCRDDEEGDTACAEGIALESAVRGRRRWSGLGIRHWSVLSSEPC